MRGRLSNVVALVGCALCATVLTAAAQNSGPRQARPRRVSRPAADAPPPAGPAVERTVSAQPSPDRETQGAAAGSVENADLAITARVTAGELLFRKVPDPRVGFTGRPRRETVWEAERENLPERVQPGVTYRDIGITLRITSVFADIDRIVAEALGEVPLSDDAPPPGEPPRRAAPPGTPAPPLDSGAPDAVSGSSPTPTARRRGPRKGRGK